MQADFSIVFEDIIVYFIAVFYAAMILFIADIARKKRNLGSEVTRRIVHLFAGAAIWTVPFYPHPWVATLVALTFVIMLALANTERFSGFFAAMARPEDLEHNSVRGPFWYAVSITVLTGIFTFTGYYTLYFVAAAAIHIMMFGDGMSTPIGMKYGTNSTRVIFGSNRSTPGTLAVFIFGFIGSLVAFWWFGIFSVEVFVSGGNILWFEMIVLALVGAITGTLVELVSPKGTDNVTLPLITCIVIFLVAIQLNLVVL
ncbi:MAG: diacylglycerol/polyprenol kinase family protein [Candidatus Thorarchaeota archaeon]|jgi:phytol kinase